MSTITYIPNEQDIAQYWERGYWISPPLVDAEQIERLRDAVNRVFDGQFDSAGSLFNGQVNKPADLFALRRVIDGWWVNEEVRDLVLDTGLGRIAATLMKADRVRLWGDQVLWKPGTGGVGVSEVANIGWHQDAAYWHINSHRNNMVTAWIALQDTDLTNGGMRTLCGSHNWGLIEDSDKFYDHDLNSQREYFEKRVGGEWIDEPCILKAGQASFHHSLCFHGSEANVTSDPRLSIVGHYMPDGAAFQPSGRYMLFMPLLGPWPQAGELLNGKPFPLVYAS